MSQSRAERRSHIFEEEERHILYLKDKGYTSIGIADLLIHNMLEILKEGIKHQHPQMSESEILEHIREILTFNKDLKKNRRGRRDPNN